jgi:hypothetical protein
LSRLSASVVFIKFLVILVVFRFIFVKRDKFLWLNAAKFHCHYSYLHQRWNHHNITNLSLISQFASSKQPCVYCLQLLLLHRYTSSLYSAIINQCCEQNSMSLGHFAILWLPKTSLTVVCVIQCLTTINFVIHSVSLQPSVYLWTIVCTYRKQNRTSIV